MVSWQIVKEVGSRNFERSGVRVVMFMRRYMPVQVHLCITVCTAISMRGQSIKTAAIVAASYHRNGLGISKRNTTAAQQKCYGEERP